MALTINQNLTTVNYNSRGTTPTWIVLHYTANNGDTAKNNTDYFKSTNRGASANYFVDENSIWQCVADKNTAWHVGNDWYNNGARNTNSIGIEMCSRKRNSSSTSLETYYLKDETVMNAVELTKSLMKKYNIPISRVCRHYDVTGKYCPAPMVYNNGTITWSKFLQLCQEEDTLMSKEYDELKALITNNNNAMNKRVAELESKNKVYNTIESVPEWYREAVKYYVDKGTIKGTSPTTLGLTADQCKIITLMYREETGNT